MAITAELIDEAVRGIVDEVHPLLVVLFGSAARGQTGPHSDIDLLIVMPDGTDRLRTAYALHRRLRHLSCAKDLVVVHESDVTLLKDNPNLVIHTALTEGREVYRAA